MHFTTFVPLLVVGAAARPALFPTTIGGAIPYPTLLSGTMDPGNMFPSKPGKIFPSKPGNMLPSLPIHPRKEAEPTSEPSFRSVTEEEDAAKAKEDKKAADEKKAAEDKKVEDDKKAKEGEFDVDAFIATLDTPSTDSKAIQEEALAGLDQKKVEKRHDSAEKQPAYPVRYDGEGEIDEEASVEALERYFNELDSEHKAGGNSVERRQLPDLAVPFSKMTPDLSGQATDLWSNTKIAKPDLSRVSTDGPDLKTGGLHFKRQMTGMPSLPRVKRQFYDWNEKTIAQAEAKAKFHDEMQSQMNAATPTTLTAVGAGSKVHVPVPSKPAPAGLDAMNEQLATLLDNLPIKRQEPKEPTANKEVETLKNATSAATNETSSVATGFYGISEKLNSLSKLPVSGLPIKCRESEEEKPAVDTKNATSAATNQTRSAAASGFRGIKNMLSKLPIGGLPIKRRGSEEEKAETDAKDDDSASAGFYGINEKLNKLSKLPIGKRQAPEAPTASQAKAFGNSLLDKYLVSLKNQHEQPAAAAPSVSSEEELATVADDATLAALSGSQPEIEESSPLVAEAAATTVEVKPETDESSPLSGLAGEESAESFAPKAAVNALEAKPETEESSPLALDGLLSEEPEALPLPEELPATEESSHLAGLAEEKPETLAAPTAVSEALPATEESSPLSSLVEEKPEDLSALQAAAEPKPATEETNPLASLADETPEDLAAPKSTSEIKSEAEEALPVADLKSEKPENLAALSAASEPKPETEEANPLASLTAENPEDLAAPTAISELEPKSSQLADLTGEQPEDLAALTATPEPETEETLPLGDLKGEQPENLAALTEPKPETEEALPIADLTGEQPEALSAPTAAGGLPSDPKSDLASSLAGLMG
jgi:hypothetical protein